MGELPNPANFETGTATVREEDILSPRSLAAPTRRVTRRSHRPSPMPASTAW
jgi:hypothetical protein